MHSVRKFVGVAQVPITVDVNSDEEEWNVVFRGCYRRSPQKDRVVRG